MELFFVSIGDDEGSNLKNLCGDIFGEENFCAQFVWNTEGNTDNQYKVKVNHEYILAYYKNAEFSESAIGRVIDPNTPEDSNLRKGYADNNINKNNPENPPLIIELPIGFPCSENELFYEAKKLDDDFFNIIKTEKFISDEVKERYSIEANSGLPVKLDDMIVKDGRLAKPCRIYVGMANKKKLVDFINNNCEEVLEDGMPIRFYINRNAAIRYRKTVKNPRNILSVLRGMGTTEKSKTYLRRLGVFYDYPKPLGLIEYLLKIGCEESGIVLDFFAGSSTTAEAVYRANSDGGNRRYILVQLPEKLDPTKKEQKSAFKFCTERGVPENIAEISKERIRKAIESLVDESPALVGDYGFKVLKLAASNISVWNPNHRDLQESLLSHQEHLIEGRSQQDILYELLLKRGVDLAVPIQSRKVSSKTIYSIGYGVLFVCLAETIMGDQVEDVGQTILDWYRELAPSSDPHVFFRDSAFCDDVSKTNMVAILEQNGITHVRSL